MNNNLLSCKHCNNQPTVDTYACGTNNKPTYIIYCTCGNFNFPREPFSQKKFAIAAWNERNKKPIFKAPTEMRVLTTTQIGNKVYTKISDVNIKAHGYYMKQPADALICPICGSTIKIDEAAQALKCDCKEPYILKSKAEDA